MSTPSYSVETLPLTKIHVDAAIQPRLDLSLSVVNEYATLYAEAEDTEPLPPLDVFVIKRLYYVADGFHRLEAAKQAKRKTLVCQVYQGTQPEAMRHAAFANLRRGLAYSHLDRERILERLLQDPQEGQRSNRDLAQVLGLSHVTVGRARHRLETLHTLETQWQALPPPRTRDPVMEQTAAFLDTDPTVIAKYGRLDTWGRSHVLTTVARRMTDRGEDEATAKAAVAQHITQQVEANERERQRRKAQRPPPPAPESPEQRAAREAAVARQVQEEREEWFVRQLMQFVDGFDGATLALHLGEPEGSGRAALVQAVRPERRQELRTLLEQAAATVEALTALLDADAEANMRAVAARMNERLQQLAYTRVKAKKETASG